MLSGMRRLLATVAGATVALLAMIGLVFMLGCARSRRRWSTRFASSGGPLGRGR